jgi:hypothetical protein
MTAPQPATTAQSSLWREARDITRSYLGNRWVLVALGALVLVAGIAFNWGWLVAAGVAPILLSTLPCLIMCGLGLCMLCRSGEKQAAASRDAADPATSSATLAVAKVDDRSVADTTYPYEEVSETEPSQAHFQPIDERRNLHA